MLTKRWLVLSDGALPTEDIYLLESAAPALRDEGFDVGRLGVRGLRWRLARWVLSRQMGANLVICRSLPVYALRWLERHRDLFGRIVYVIDDDIAAAAADDTLPEAYRKRMGRLASLQPRLLALADVVVASSEALAARFEERHRDVRVLTPSLISPLPDLHHFEQSTWCLGFHGTRAHLADLQHIASALIHLHDEQSALTMEVMMGQHTPPELRGLERVAAPQAKSWRAFQRHQQAQRLQIGVAPLLDTPFNRGKSFIKFFDITAMGGVGVYSRRSPYTEIVEDGETGLLVEDCPQAWLEALRYLVANPETAKAMAEKAAQVARERGDPAHAVAFWRALGSEN
ncbi:glycosyltransferase [Halomonas sabkhae]|uniref:glycosyltransferase family protein n=1 Tax=Halomonas sabkhae TaxID=626223 RepID=UPI0025B53828|nr:glycosyltransferase [Halomonas sabkhae]MDN3526606.1 glycosyltransferase [Halomonas sabkhae]